MDLELSAAELLHAPYAGACETHEVALAGGGTVRFRLPTGADREAAAALEDVAAGARLLVRALRAEHAREGGGVPRHLISGGDPVGSPLVGGLSLSRMLSSTSPRAATSWASRLRAILVWA